MLATVQYHFFCKTKKGRCARCNQQYRTVILIISQFQSRESNTIPMADKNESPASPTGPTSPIIPAKTWRQLNAYERHQRITKLNEEIDATTQKTRQKQQAQEYTFEHILRLHTHATAQRKEQKK